MSVQPKLFLDWSLKTQTYSLLPWLNVPPTQRTTATLQSNAVSRVNKLVLAHLHLNLKAGQKQKAALWLMREQRWIFRLLEATPRILIEARAEVAPEVGDLPAKALMLVLAA